MKNQQGTHNRGGLNNSFKPQLLTSNDGQLYYKQKGGRIVKIKPLNKDFKYPPQSAGNHNNNYKTKKGVSIMKPNGLTYTIKPVIMLSRKQAWSEWLDTMPWNYFITLTTSYEMSLKSARKLFERFHNGLQIPGQENWSFWVGEKFSLRDSYHIHGFLKVSFPWDPELLEMLWDDVSISGGKSSCKKNGRPHHISQFRKRNPKKKAAAYIMKDCGYSVKELSGHDFDIYKGII